MDRGHKCARDSSIAEEEVVSARYIACDCGWTCQGTDERLIAECIAHAREVHGMDLTPEQILAVAVPLDEHDTPDAAS
jgi:predicted small metal-binding protein